MNKSSLLIGAFIVLFLIFFGSCIAFQNSDRPRTSGHLSSSARRALKYMDELPPGQKEALLYGGGSAEDQANAIANMIESGNLDGLIEYQRDNQ